MMKKSVLFIIIVLALGNSCVEKIGFSSSIADSQLVVDGQISDKSGPYTIKLSRTINALDFTTTRAVSASKVVISDNLGNSETLTEVYAGTFQTNPNGIRGVMEREYVLRVETRDGNIYESSPEKITPAGSVDSIYYEFEKYQPLSGSPRYQFRVFINSTGESLGNNLYRWKFTGTYKVETHPELRTQSAGQGRIPDPPPCSGYTKSLEQIGPCECCVCWVNLINTTPKVSNHKLVSGEKFNNIEVGLVPVEYWTFFEKVQIEVEQISLSVSAFNFWKTVSDQKEGSSSLFQPSIGKAVSNISLKSGKGEVQGLFSAHSSSKKIIFLGIKDIPIGPSVIPDAPPPVAESCLLAFPFSTTQKPMTW
jgi:hypothetical protein